MPRRQRVTESQGGAAPFVPAKPDATLPQLTLAVQKCRGCDLYKNATQGVFGEIRSDEHSPEPTGRVPARVALMLVGEQPGDQEDQQGRPFVGPSGKLLDRALAEAGIDRAQAYVTNAVKHFKWTPSPRGKRRLHKKPSAGEVSACRPWLAREILLVKPRVVVCLGATAAWTILGPKFRLTASRGRAAEPPPELREILGTARCLATAHPSAILRAPDHEGREREYNALVKDLRAAAALASG
jgi:uracil-DNA glycosylase family protein